MKCARSLPATLEAVEEFFVEFRRRSQALLDRVNCFAAELLVREALTNAVVHGCHSDPGKQVRCRLRLKGRRLLIAVEDDGEGFDWRAAPARPAGASDCSGRGIADPAQVCQPRPVQRPGQRGDDHQTFLMRRMRNDSGYTGRQQSRVRPAGDDIVAASIPELRSQDARDRRARASRTWWSTWPNVHMVDSSGIGLLISAHNSLRKVGGRLAVIHASAEILELFQTMRMHQHFSVSGN